MIYNTLYSETGPVSGCSGPMLFSVKHVVYCVLEQQRVDNSSIRPNSLKSLTNFIT
jgi:hypothetical protein